MPNSANHTSSSPPRTRASSAAVSKRSTGTTATMPRTKTISIEPVRARAFEACLAHFSDVFMKGNTAYAIPSGQRVEPRAHAAVRRLHLLDGLVCRGRAAGRHRFLHPQLALRTAGRQPPHGRKRDLDRRQHHHAAGGHLRHGLVVRVAERRRSPRARFPLPIRWAPGPPRPRSAPRSSISGWSRRSSWCRS